MLQLSSRRTHPLTLINLEPLMAVAIGRPEVVIGLIDGPVASHTAAKLTAQAIGIQGEANPMSSAATLLPDIERQRLRALASADTVAAAPLHAEDYWLITPNGSEMTQDDYLGAIASGQLSLDPPRELG
jgi:hypothetical protein